MNLLSSIAPSASNGAARPVLSDATGTELKRGAWLNAAAMVTSNFRGIFTLLVARLIGPASLGIFSVAWAATDLVSKLGILGLDDAITTFIARAQAVGDHSRSKILFRSAVTIALFQSIIVATVLIIVVHLWGSRLGIDPEMVSAIGIIFWVLPGLALYRVSTSVSRGMKVMQHDIYSRGITESAVTTVALVAALAVGYKTFAPEIAAIVGTTAAGLVALLLAARLFRGTMGHQQKDVFGEARALIGYALPIGADQFLNAFIWRVDVILLGWLVDRAPGVTLTSLGIYAAVVGVANGLRRVSQPFTPIFVPVVAGMTATGEHEQAFETYGRLLQWMLWILLPFAAVIMLAGKLILLIFGPAFQSGSIWLVIVAVACATNAFINLGETVIMVQRPAFNFLNSLATAVLGALATFLFIRQFGVMGAALGILFTYSLQGIIRAFILRFAFGWRNPWKSIRVPVITAAAAGFPALLCRLLLNDLIGQISSALVFLGIFGLARLRYSRPVS